MSRSKGELQEARIRFHGIPYVVDVGRIRRALVPLEALLEPGSEEGAGLRGCARRLGVSHMTLRRIRDGEQVQLASLTKVVHGLGLDLGDVLHAEWGMRYERQGGQEVPGTPAGAAAAANTAVEAPWPSEEPGGDLGSVAKILPSLVALNGALPAIARLADGGVEAAGYLWDLVHDAELTRMIEAVCAVVRFHNDNEAADGWLDNLAPAPG